MDELTPFVQLKIGCAIVSGLAYLGTFAMSAKHVQWNDDESPQLVLMFGVILAAVLGAMFWWIVVALLAIAGIGLWIYLASRGRKRPPRGDVIDAPPTPRLGHEDLARAIADALAEKDQLERERKQREVERQMENVRNSDWSPEEKEEELDYLQKKRDEL